VFKVSCGEAGEERSPKKGDAPGKGGKGLPHERGPENHTGKQAKCWQKRAVSKNREGEDLNGAPNNRNALTKLGSIDGDYPEGNGITKVKNTGGTQTEPRFPDEQKGGISKRLGRDEQGKKGQKQ